MKNPTRLLGLLFACAIFVAGGFAGWGACGGTGTTTTAVEVNTLDGVTGVPVTSTFVYNFSKVVDTTTVTSATYFILPTPMASPASSVKAALDESICNPELALDAVINCTSTTACILDPVNDLMYSTNYTICLTSGIAYSDGVAFEGFMAQFTTESAGETVTITAAKLVRLDGTELDFSAAPIPRSVSIKYTLSHALTEEADRTAFENAVSLVDETTTAVSGTYTWAEDYTTVVFTPAAKLLYRSQYTVEVNTDAMPIKVSKQVDPSSLIFTTMTKRDVNGDGYADVIVGAPGYDNGSNKGRAYILFGSASGIANCDLPACTSYFTLTGAINGDELGYSAVSSAGDVNGDGYEDIIIGAYGYSGGAEQGQAYIIHGGASLSSSYTISQVNTTLSGTQDGVFAEAVSGAGDVNGDGFDDVVVGERYYGTNFEGRAYVFLGSANGVSDCDLSSASCADSTITGAAGNDELGYSVSTAGDVNGDGYDDIIVGSPTADSASNHGRAYVFHGSASGIGDCDLSSPACADTNIRGASTGNYLGWSVSTAGDINGDGFDDIVVGAYQAGGSNEGKAYVLVGSASGIDDCDLSTCTPRATITGANNGDRLGYSVYTAGDVNGDGYDDILIAANYADGGGTNKGEAYVFLGSASGINSCDLSGSCTANTTVTGADDNDYLGESVSTAGDVNGDGYDDIIVGAYRAAVTFGRAYVFNGSGSGISDCDLSGVCTADTTITGEHGNENLGYVR